MKFWPLIRERAEKAGFSESDGTLLLLSCGAEDALTILAELRAFNPTLTSVDTIISVLTLCSVPSPERTIAGLAHSVLKPGGTFLYFEHVRSPLADVAWWQHVWTPIRRLAFDGCSMNRPTDVLIDGLEGVWETKESWGLEGEPVDHLFIHRVGRYVKTST